MSGSRIATYDRRDQYRAMTRTALRNRKQALEVSIVKADKRLKVIKQEIELRFIRLSIQLMRIAITLIEQELQERETRATAGRVDRSW